MRRFLRSLPLLALFACGSASTPRPSNPPPPATQQHAAAAPPAAQSEDDGIDALLDAVLARNAPDDAYLAKVRARLPDAKDVEVCELRLGVVGRALMHIASDVPADALQRHLDRHPHAIEEARDRYVAALAQREPAVGDLFRAPVDCAAVAHRESSPQADARSLFGSDEAAAWAEAKRTHRGVLLFFSAAWAPACQELVKGPFSDPETRAWLTQRYVPVLIDVTDEDDLAVQATTKKYKVTGVPAIIAFDAAGNESARIDSFVDSAALRARLEGASAPH